MKRKSQTDQKTNLPRFIAPTTAALTTWRYLLWTMDVPGLHLVIGESGSGKSTLLRALAYKFSDRVVYVEAPACAYSTYPAGSFLKNALRTVEGTNYLSHFESVSVVIERIARSLSKQRRALIVDESGHLPRSLLQLLRWVSDAHYQNPSTTHARGGESSMFDYDSDGNLCYSDDSGEDAPSDDAQSDDAFLTPTRRGNPLILAGVPRLRKRVAALDEVEGRVISEHTLPALTVSDIETILLTRFTDRQIVKWVMAQANGKVRRALTFAEQVEDVARQSGIDPRALTFNDLMGTPMAAIGVI